MSSELELSKQHITELEAENSGLRIKLSVSDAEIAELKRRNAETLKSNAEYNERRDAENTKLRAKIEELESENVEFRDRLTKVEQKQTLQSALTANDNSSNDSSSNFNLVADQVSMVTHHKKPLVDTSLSEEQIPEWLPEVSVPDVNIPVMDKRDQTTLEDKETDAFLNAVYKKEVSNEIRQRNQEKRLQIQESPQHILKRKCLKRSSVLPLIQ